MGENFLGYRQHLVQRTIATNYFIRNKVINYDWKTSDIELARSTRTNIKGTDSCNFSLIIY